MLSWEFLAQDLRNLRSFGFFFVILGIFGPGSQKFEKRRVEVRMMMQMMSLPRAECACERNCEKSLF